MEAKFKYYMIIGKNKYIPITYYAKAANVAHAKQHFYLYAGDYIETVIPITKKRFNANNLTHTTT